MRRLLKKTAAAFLSFALLALSPGPQSYAATTSHAISGVRIGTASPLIAIPPSVAIPPLATLLPQTGPLAAAAFAYPVIALANTPVPPTAQATVSSIQQLAHGADRILSAAAPSTGAEGSAAALDAVFDSQAPKTVTALLLPAGTSTAAPSSLAPASGQSRRGGLPQATLRQSLGHSARVGFLASVAVTAIAVATIDAASTLGYHFHPDYEDPFPDDTIATIALCAVFLGPIAEEMIFRGGLMGGLRAITDRLPMIGRYWMPATLSSLAFTAIHETSDPVLFASRFAGSMIMSWAFHLEGLTGSIFAHAFVNGLFVLPLVFEAALPSQAAGLASLAIIPGSLYLAWTAYRKTIAEAHKKKTGQLVAFKLSASQALLLAAALIVGFLFVADNSYWIIGALGWLIYALRR